MKMPTSKAPHIWWKVSRKTLLSTSKLGRINASIINQETRMEVPAMKGLKEKLTFVGLLLMEEVASALKLNNVVVFHDFKMVPFQIELVHHGPVHSTTTTIRITKGRKAAHMECCCEVSPMLAAVRASCSSSLSSTPPYPSTVLGRQTFSSSSSTTKQTSAPATSGR